MNSLTPIVSLTETLSDSMRDPHGKGFTKEETRDALDAIFRRAKGLMHFVQRYRMLTGIAEPILKKTKLADLIKHIENWYASSQNDFTCQVCMPTECGQQILCIDLPQMEQVLINLVKNACETSATLVSIDAQLSEDERWMIISVTDNGGGFPESVRENLFTPFFTTKSEGQGIGLAVCRQIVSNHGGLIGAENAEVGARFTVRLPM
jgi:signal transduction histidine kinase